MADDDVEPLVVTADCPDGTDPAYLRVYLLPKDAQENWYAYSDRRSMFIVDKSMVTSNQVVSYNN